MITDRKPHPFDDFMRREVERQTFDFDPKAWEGLSEMLDTQAISTGRESFFSRVKTFIKNHWLGLTSVMIIALAISSLMVSESDLSAKEPGLDAPEGVTTDLQKSLPEEGLDKSRGHAIPSKEEIRGSSEVVEVRRGDMVLETLPLYIPVSLTPELQRKVTIEPLTPIDIDGWLRTLPEDDDKKHLIW